VKAVLVALALFLAQLFSASGVMADRMPSGPMSSHCAAHLAQHHPDSPQPDHHTGKTACATAICHCAAQTVLFAPVLKHHARLVLVAQTVMIATSAPDRLDWPPPLRPPLA
jgi:hypothetical protein